MPTYITFNALGEDSIRIFLSDPIVVGLCSRGDFPKLTEIEEVHKPGIYILLNGEGKRYVGQATGGVHSRLNSHEKNKNWWTELIFIAHAYGALSPDKLNYLEAKLIADFRKLNYDMDNGNGGNQNSYIGTPQKLEAERFLHDALETLTSVAHRDLYAVHKSSRRRVASISDTARRQQDSEGKRQSSQREAMNFDSFTPPFTASDKTGRHITRDELTGSQAGLYFSWVSELMVEQNDAARIMENFTSAWRVQDESSEHRNQNPSSYLLTHNGVYLHPHSNGYPLSALRDMKRFSDFLDLELSVVDSTGKSLLEGVNTQSPRGRKKVGKTSFHIEDSRGTTVDANKALGGRGGAYVDWLRALCEDSETRGKLMQAAHDSRATLLKVSEVDPSPEGKQFYAKVADKLWAYTVLSKDNALNSVQEIASLLSLQVEVKEVAHKKETSVS